MPKDFDHSKVGFSTGIKGTIGSTEVEHSIDSNFIKGKLIIALERADRNGIN